MATVVDAFVSAGRLLHSGIVLTIKECLTGSLLAHMHLKLFVEAPRVRLSCGVTNSEMGMATTIDCLKEQLVCGFIRAIGVILCAPTPLGHNTTPGGKHVHWSEVKMLGATNSKLL